jgi:hypothetical protein
MMKLRNMVGDEPADRLAVTSASAQEVGLPGCTDYYCFMLDTQTAESPDRDR